MRRQGREQVFLTARGGDGGECGSSLVQGERSSVSNSKACPGSHPAEGVVAGRYCCVSQDNSFSF